ncbi:MAG TPA: hypothetical protein VF681_06215 [Abditibacteriaceae bacterium]
MKLRSFLAATVLCTSPFTLSSVVRAQEEAAVPDAAPATTSTELSEATAEATPAQRSAASLVSEAFTVASGAYGDEGPQARIAAVRGAATLLPRLAPEARNALTPRWIALAQNSDVPRVSRLSAYSAFFDNASRLDPLYASGIAYDLPDAAARAGAFIDLSEQAEKTNYRESRNYVGLAQQAARRETDVTLRARALTFVAYRMASLDPTAREAAVREASSQARLVQTPRVRDYLLTEVVGAASKFDLILARRIAADISDEGLKNLAIARTNISEISQTTLTSTTQDRVAALAKAAARYDVRAIPVLIQLPPQPDVLQSISGALPAIYPSARPGVDAQLLERIWNYTKNVDASVQRDELQSRVARLMVLNDLWRGRDWGKQLAWKGGRVQVGAFLKDVLISRRSQVRAGALQDTAQGNVNRAIQQARSLPPAARTEALLLIAGQILG